METTVQENSIFIRLQGGDELHLKRFFIDTGGLPVFLLHGSVENGRIFYSKNGKGLAPYLARQGFDVFVGDLRGRNLSRPKIDRKSTWGQHESITEDIPAFIHKIQEIKGGAFPQQWIAHSWGGVLMMCYLARFENRTEQVKSLVFFGTKRSIHTINFKKILTMDLGWNLLGSLLTSIFGYLPAREFGFGSDNESRMGYIETKKWVKPSEWIDLVDGFDYKRAVRHIKIPPTLWFGGVNDPFLGNPNDIRRFIDEIGILSPDLRILGKKYGSQFNYDHLSMLVSPEAQDEVFPQVTSWLRVYGKP